MNSRKNNFDVQDLSRDDTVFTVTHESISRDDFVRYVGASGEFAPIHYDEPLAKEAGYPSVFAPGMMSAGYVASTVSDRFGLENIERIRTRVVNQLWPGTDVTIEGKVTKVDETNGVVEIELIVTDQDGQPIINGDATVRVSGGLSTETDGGA